ncbi:hypothetical protein FJT64_018512 [Amphibalanus amphitrite]|uniref:Uncharacterized protein n=1 Tax=Amphibalanus amphitrite TaxID=1232801 RepID=A0A6A4V3Y7_AMPAM|nr:extensin-like [Amphibalanus amphitrite]KAF0289346.1 hypothetical protein FJT64_012400 [Amphibalanus amphitrite]KAF0310505.1 hypothetical protein FJT64_018512 [Amphibalanus amphitrite]
MVSPVSWALLLVGASVASADPDFYSAWCPCRTATACPNYYGRYSFYDDVQIFGQVPVCKDESLVRCCSAFNIPEGFDPDQHVQYFPEQVDTEAEAVHQALLLSGSTEAEIQDFKAKQEKLKRDIANGIANPNPPCGCYTAGTCPGRYSTKSTGRDIGCLAGFETCCFLDDPWPNYQVTNLTINAPCSIAKGCSRFFGASPFDISSFGPLEPCYLGQNRCLDYLSDGSSPQPSILRPEPPQEPSEQRPSYSRPTQPPTQRPTYAPSPRPTYAPAPRPTYAPAPRPTYAPRRPTYAPTRRPTYAPAPQPTYAPAPQPTYRPTRRPTYRPRTTRPTYRTTVQTTYRPRTTPAPYRPPTTTYRPTTTTYRTTTRKLPQPEVADSGSDNIFEIVANGAYLPPSAEYGSPEERSEDINIEFALPF